MKSILKIALISLTVISLTFANNSLLSRNQLQLSRDIIQAARKTAERKKGCTPGVRHLIKGVPMKDVTVNLLKQYFNNFTLEDIGFIFEASFEKFVSKEDPTSDDIELFEYLNVLLNNKVSQISNFISKIQKLKNSTDAQETIKTMKNELENLYNALSQSKNLEERKIANKIRIDINAMIDQKGKIAVGSIICKKAKNNKK